MKRCFASKKTKENEQKNYYIQWAFIIYCDYYIKVAKIRTRYFWLYVIFLKFKPNLWSFDNFAFVPVFETMYSPLTPSPFSLLNLNFLKGKKQLNQKKLVINPLEPKNIKLENDLSKINLSVRGFKIYMALLLKPTAYFHTLNTWIPLFLFSLWSVVPFLFLKSYYHFVFLQGKYDFKLDNAFPKLI